MQVLFLPSCRAIRLRRAIGDLGREQSWALSGRAALALDAIEPQLHSTETARHVVDQVMRSAGGGAFRNTSELARLQRDVLAGIYHPSNPESVYKTVASDLFGS